MEDLDAALEVLADAAESKRKFKAEFDDLSEKDRMDESAIVDTFKKAVERGINEGESDDDDALNTLK